MARTAKRDNVRELQRTLYRAAKADPGRRFHALFDKVVGSDVLERAWGQVRRNRGAAGIDRTTIIAVERAPAIRPRADYDLEGLHDRSGLHDRGRAQVRRGASAGSVAAVSAAGWLGHRAPGVGSLQASRRGVARRPQGG